MKKDVVFYVRFSIKVMLKMESWKTGKKIAFSAARLSEAKCLNFGLFVYLGVIKGYIANCFLVTQWSFYFVMIISLLFL